VVLYLYTAPFKTMIVIAKDRIGLMRDSTPTLLFMFFNGFSVDTTIDSCRANELRINTIGLLMGCTVFHRHYFEYTSISY
jgi:hypothetical protein